MNKFFYGLVLLLCISHLSNAQKGDAHFNAIVQSLHSTNNSVVMISAHRGSHLDFPENSLAAIRGAIQIGVDFAEIDIRFTKDRHMVLMHDKTINRTTNGKGLVSDFTFEEIRKFRLKQKDSLTQEIIPTLEEALSTAKGKIILDLDIKQDECIDSIITLVQRTGSEKNCLFFVYEPALAKMIKAKNADFQLLVRTESAQAVDTLFSVIRPEAVHIDPSHYTEAVIRTLKGGKCRVWINALGDVDKKAVDGDLTAYSELLKNGVNIIQTDQPAMLKKYLESKGLYYRK
jgi:glycerophosphoryl diester phosphodiesterase